LAGGRAVYRESNSLIAMPVSTTAFCVSALPASVFVILLLRPSVSTFEAVVATEPVVCFPVPDCARTLPARRFCVGLEFGLESEGFFQ